MGRRRTEARRRSIEAGATATSSAPIDSVEVLIARARRLWTRGDLHRALTVLRAACNEDEWRARSWTLFAARLAEAGQREEAAQAFCRARWLRKRAGDTARAAITERLAVRAAA
jgi:Flp pilus assembly protein TadD